MTLFKVFSISPTERDGDSAVAVLETSRTDPRVAEQDKEIIASILHRRAYIEESQS